MRLGIGAAGAPVQVDIGSLKPGEKVLLHAGYVVVQTAFEIPDEPLKLDHPVKRLGHLARFVMSGDHELAHRQISARDLQGDFGQVPNRTDKQRADDEDGE